MLRVRSPQDLGAGLLFLFVGAVGIYLGIGLQFGTARAMGPGYFPTIVSGLIMLIGVVVSARALTIDGPAIERSRLRPIVFLMVAVGVFGLLIDRLGLAICSVLLILIAASARRQVNLVETVIFAVAMSAFVVLLFAYGLGAQMPVWWTF